jgi:hypothetical protein
VFCGLSINSILTPGCAERRPFVNLRRSRAIASTSVLPPSEVATQERKHAAPTPLLVDRDARSAVGWHRRSGAGFGLEGTDIWHFQSELYGTTIFFESSRAGRAEQEVVRWRFTFTL